MAPAAITAKKSSRTASEKGKHKSKSKKSEQSKSAAANQWVFFAKEDVLTSKEDSTDPECQSCLCKLRHPRTENGVYFLMSSEHRVYEVNNFDEKYHSWFIGESVHSGGQIYITSQVDPLFLVLPYLTKSKMSQCFMPLDQIVRDEDFPMCQRLLACVTKDQVNFVADVKEIEDDIQVMCYNKSRTMNWLKAKVEAVAEALKSKKVNVSARSSHSAIFIPSKESQVPRESYMRFALGLVGDFLPVDVEDQLKDQLGLKSEPDTLTTAIDSSNEHPAKRAKTCGDMTPTEDYSGNKIPWNKIKTGKLTVAQRKLSKVDKTGMKSISSFFAAKN